MTKIRTLINRVLFSLCALVLSTPMAFARSCPALQDFIDDGSDSNFLLEPAYLVVAKACADIAQFSWGYFATSLQAVMALGVAIYIALYTLRNIGAFSQQDVGAYLSNEKTGVIPLLLKSAFIIFLLSYQDFVYKYLVSPVVGTGIDVGQMVTSGGTFNDASSFAGAGSVRAMFTEVIDQAREFNNKLYTIVAMGRLMLCLAFLPTVFLDWFWILIPFGLALYIFGWLLIIAISFYLLDVLFRLGVACIVLPFAIACGISKLTAQYTQKTWDMFVNIAFNFMTLGVVITFTIKMIEVSMTGSGGEEGAEAMKKFFEKPELNVADAQAISDSIGIMSFVLTALSCMIAMKLFSSVEDMADALSSTTTVAKDSGIGKQAGKEFAEKTNSAVKEPVKGLGKAAGKEAAATIGNTRIGHRLGIG